MPAPYRHCLPFWRYFLERASTARRGSGRFTNATPTAAIAFDFISARIAARRCIGKETATLRSAGSLSARSTHRHFRRPATRSGRSRCIRGSGCRRKWTTTDRTDRQPQIRSQNSDHAGHHLNSHDVPWVLSVAPLSPSDALLLKLDETSSGRPDVRIKPDRHLSIVRGSTVARSVVQHSLRDTSFPVDRAYRELPVKRSAGRSLCHWR